MAEFLLEIGWEEMPASWLPGLAAQLRERFSEIAGRELLPGSDVRVLWTPRRLVLVAELPERQAGSGFRSLGAVAEGREGPGGQWTGAAQGFAKKNGTTPEALLVAAKDLTAPEQRYLLFIRKHDGPRRARRAALRNRGDATLAGLPEAHELGRVARRRQGGVHVRPSDSLDRGAAGRQERALCDLRSGCRRQGRGHPARGPSDARPSLLAAGSGRRSGSREFIRRPAGEAESCLCPARSGAARGAHPRRPAGRRLGRRQGSRCHRGMAGSGRVPERRGRQHSGRVPVAAARSPRDGPRPPPEVPAHRLERQREALCRGHQHRRFGGRRDGQGHGARGGRTATRRGLLLRRGPQAAVGGSRGRPGRSHLPREARELP